MSKINRNDATAALSLHNGDVKLAAKSAGCSQREMRGWAKLIAA